MQKSDTDQDVMLTISETATRLTLCERTVYNLVKRGKLRATKLGRTLRFLRSEIDKFVKESTGK